MSACSLLPFPRGRDLRWLFLTLLILVPLPLCGQAPEKIVQLGEMLSTAAADLAKIQAPLQPSIRYLTLSNLPAGERLEATRVLSGHCNSLSRDSDLTPP